MRSTQLLLVVTLGLGAGGGALGLAACTGGSTSGTPGEDSGPDATRGPEGGEDATEPQDSGGGSDAATPGSDASQGSDAGSAGDAAPDGAPDGAQALDAAPDAPPDAPPYVFDGGVSFVEYPLPAGDAGAGSPTGITMGPDGNMWFLVINAVHAVGRITPAGAITEFPAAPGAIGDAIVAGSDGALWFPSQLGVERIAVDGGEAHFADDSGVGVTAYGIASGADGDLWMSVGSPPSVVRVTTEGAFVRFALPAAFTLPPSAVRGIAAGPGGVWVADDGAQLIAQVTENGTGTAYGVPDAGINFGPAFLLAGPDGDMWYTRRLDPVVGRLALDGSVSEIPIPNGTSGGAGLGGVLVTGQDGNVWLTDQYANALVRVTPGGTVSSFTVPTTNAGLVGLAAGPGHTLWFTEFNAGKIGVATLY
jgi:virginiamycin B lyase